MFEQRGDVVGGAHTTEGVGGGYTQFAGTREEWALRVVHTLVPILREFGIEQAGEPRDVRISIASVKGKEGGYTSPSAKSLDGKTNHIVISTRLIEPEHLVYAITHEVLHYFDDCQSGHKASGRWGRWARALGMPVRGWTDHSPAMQDIIDRVLREVGVPVEHRSTKVPGDKEKAPSSQVKFTCPQCASFARIPRAAFLAGYFTVCGACRVDMHADEEPQPQERAKQERRQQQEPPKRERAERSPVSGVPKSIHEVMVFVIETLNGKKAQWATELSAWFKAQEITRPTPETYFDPKIVASLKRLRQLFHPDRFQDEASKASANVITQYLNRAAAQK